MLLKIKRERDYKMKNFDNELTIIKIFLKSYENMVSAYIFIRYCKYGGREKQLEQSKQAEKIYYTSEK